MYIQARSAWILIPNMRQFFDEKNMSTNSPVKWNDRTAQQLVSYEALFKLIDEIHPLEDIQTIAQCAAGQWKYFANVCAWRLVVQVEDTYTVIDAFRGKAAVSTVSDLCSWDTHFMRGRKPALYKITLLPENPAVPEHLAGNGVCEISVLPFVKMNTCYGLLTVSARHEPFTDIDKKFIRIFGSHFSSLTYNILMQQKDTNRLINRANHDYLTGILNRGAVMEKLEMLLRLAIRTKEPFSIIIADIDHFKLINDTYGHQAGDKVLLEAVQTLYAQTRDTDLLGRYGGEEFIFVLYACSSKEALQAAERRRLAIEHLTVDIQDADKPVKITMSFGITSLLDSDVNSDTLIARADAALYEAKNGGRNRCILRD